MPAEAKVVRFDGEGPIPLPGEPCQSVIDVLEALLQMAKDGAIIGVVGAQVYPSTEGFLRPASRFVGGYVNSSATVGALEDAKYVMLQGINSGS